MYSLLPSQENQFPHLHQWSESESFDMNPNHLQLSHTASGLSNFTLYSSVSSQENQSEKNNVNTFPLSQNFMWGYSTRNPFLATEHAWAIWQSWHPQELLKQTYQLICGRYRGTSAESSFLFALQCQTFTNSLLGQSWPSSCLYLFRYFASLNHIPVLCCLPALYFHILFLFFYILSLYFTFPFSSINPRSKSQSLD